MLKKVNILLVLLLSVLTLTAVATPQADFCFLAKSGSGDTPAGMQLHDGAVINKDGLLQIKPGSRATIPALSKWNLNHDGFTAVITYRTARPDLLAFFGKKDVFVMRHGTILWTDWQLNANDQANRISWGRTSPIDQFTQLTITAEYLNDSAAGRVGYLFSCYINGEICTQNMFTNMEHNSGDGEFYLGNDLGSGFELNGEIAEFQFFNRPLSGGEVYALAESNPYIAGGDKKTPAAAQKKLTVQPADTPEMAWLKNALVRSGISGGTDEKLIEAANALNGNKLPADFNQKQNCYKLIDTPNLLWLISLNNTTEPAIAAVFDRRNQSELSGKRFLAWVLDTNVGRVADDSETVTSSVENYRETADGASFVIKWQEPRFTATSQVNIKGPRLEADFKLDNHDPDFELKEVHYPQFNIKPAKDTGYKAIIAEFCGRVKDADFYGSYYYYNDYPSIMSMQFGGIYDENKNGIYFGFEENIPVCKKVGFGGIGGVYRTEYSTCVPLKLDSKGGNSYTSQGPAVLEVYQGKWFEAGQIYKRFLQEKTNWLTRDLPRKDTPEWYRNNPFWIMAGELEEILYLREYLELPFAFDCTGYWCDFYDAGTPDAALIKEMVNVGAREPLGPEKARKHLKILQEAGVSCRVYFNARLWAYNQAWISRGEIPDYGPDGVGACIKNPDGSSYKENYGKELLVMCPGSDLWQDIVYKNVRKIAELGFNGVYLDQTVDAHFVPCYDKEHGHEARSPYVWHKGFFEIMKRIRTELRADYPNFSMDGEGGVDVWTPYMDGYLSWLYSCTRDHVPLIQSILGGGQVQFVARGTECHGGFGSWDAFFARMGEQFVNSEQLGWIHINDFRFGVGRRIFTKKLSHLRVALLDYFNASDMQKPLEFATPMPQMTCLWGCMFGIEKTNESILHTVWKRLDDGKIMIPFVNTSNETVTIQPVVPYNGTLTVCAEGSSEGVNYSSNQPPVLKLAPHEVQIWFIDPDNSGVDSKNIRKVAEIMAKIPTWDDGAPLPYKQDFAKCNQIVAEPGRWITANDASWLALVFRESQPTVGYVTSGAPEQTSNWLLAKTGGLAFFGEVDFGADGHDLIEVELSGTAEGAGGKIRLVDLTGDGVPEKTLAEVEIPDCGKYFDFTVVKVPLDKSITGKHKVAWSFERPVMMRRWRIVE